MAHPEDCGMCSKKPGLPILLVGYEVSPNSAKAPKLSGNFKEPPIPLGATAHYTLRLLPSGTIYLYDPANTQTPWQGFNVTEDGHFYPFRIGKHGPDTPTNSSGVTPCNPNEFGAIAQAITIPFAENAGDVWICYSNVAWTKEVWQRFNDNVDGCRDKVMRKFNVKGWLGNPTADHAALVKDMAGKIVDFSDAVKAGEFKFSANPLQRRSWSLTNWGKIAEAIGAPLPTDPMHPTQEEAAAIAKKLAEKTKAGMTGSERDTLFKNAMYGTWDVLVGKFNRLCAGSSKTAGKGLVLALSDTVGVTSDLSTLTTHASKRFAEHIVKQDTDLYRKLVSTQTIEGVRQMVCTKAIKTAQINLQTKITAAYASTGSFAAAFAPTVGLPPEDYKRVSDEAWAEYAPFYDENQIKEFKKDYATKLSNWNDAEIASLSDAHGKWLESTALADTMKWHYDAANLESGRAYARAVSLCIGSGQETAEVRQAIEKWVNGEVTDTKNLYLRALVFNQEETAKAVVQFVSKVSGKPLSQQMTHWKEFLGNGIEPIKPALKKDDSVTHLLLSQGSGVLMEAMQADARAGSSSSPKHWVAVLGGVSGKAVIHVQGCCLSSRGLLNFASNRIYDCLSSTGSSFASEGHRVIDTIYRRDMVGEWYMEDKKKGLSADPATMAGIVNIMVAIEEAKIGANMTDADVGKLLGSAIPGESLTSPKRSLFNLDRHISNMRGHAAMTGNLVGLFFNLAAAGGALTAYNEGGKRHPELKNEFDQDELAMRLGVGIITCVAALSDSASAVLQKLVPSSWMAQGLGFRLNVGLKLFAKGLGALGSGLVAYRDAIRVKEAVVKDKGKGLLIASAAILIIDSVAFGIAFYAFVSYIIAVINYLRTGVAIVEVSSIPMAGMRIPLVNVMILLFLAGMLAISWYESKERKDNLQTWLSRSTFGNGKRGAKYSDLQIEQSALKMVFQ